MSRLSSQLSFGDLTGGINNVDSKETINSSTRKTETPDMLNVEYFQLGGIKSMEGNELFDDHATRQTSAVIGGWEYIKGSQRYMVIGTYDGSVKVYDETQRDFIEIYKFSHVSDRMSFCNMNNGVIVTNGIDDLIFYEKDRRQILTGDIDLTVGSPDVVGNGTEFTTELMPGDTIYVSTTHQVEDPENTEQYITETVAYVYFVDSITDDTHLTLRTDADETITDANYYLSEVSECNAQLTNTDPEEPGDFQPVLIRGLAIQFYNGRLWVGTENGLFYSQVGLYNKWDIYYDAGVIYSIYNDSSRIAALGLWSEYLMVHKELNTYILSMTGDSSTISIKPFSNITCESQQSWIQSNTKYFVYSREYMDIYPLVQHTMFNDKFLGEPITKKIRNIFKNIRQADSSKIFCVSRPKARQMIFYMPSIEAKGSSYAVIYDFQTKSWLARLVPEEVTIAFNYKNNVYIGTNDGLVLKEFSSLTFKMYDEDNDKIYEAPIKAYYKSPWFDWAGDYMQSFSEFVVEIANDYNNDFIIRTWKDGGGRTEDRRITSDALTGNALIWEGIYDDENNTTVWDTDRWVTGNFENIRMLLPNNVFEDFQLEICTQELGQAFAIYQYAFRRIETDEAPW